MAQEHENQGNPVVHVLYLKTNDDTTFHVHWNTTLQQVWDQAYTELREAKQPGDTLECENGTKLGSYLGQTLEQLRDQKICVDRKFQIRGPSGGA